ncbi:CaiB/BaiF CoA transferase family protein [Streptomyces odontomachi]|uniref:CaiB/BaiF CoA transferase family protein n=1 Tax=Streptomyces odontomachi TaxID=2944940 RepID=UPI00210C3B6B|nr:CoA transferase [Streptomyces sp. ODS25]
MTGFLDGIKVIEFCSVAAGPFCGMLLADMGADVIKVEHPAAGDSMRAWPPITSGYSENFASLNRNKRSVALDLKDPGGQAAARELIAGADVVVENNRPGVMARLGLDHDTVREGNPGLVYCSISAFGQSGPRAAEGGFDLTLQAMSGIMSVTGEPGGDPVKCGVPIADFTTGLYAAFAVAAALRDRTRTGQGGHIDASMFGCSLAVAALQTSQFFGSGADPVKLGSAHPRNAPYQAFRTADGHLALAAGNNSLFAATCAAVDRPELVHDARFATTELRSRHQDALREILEEAFADRTVDELLTTFRAAKVPCAPINTYSQALADPQVEHMGWVRPLTLPSGDTTETFGPPLWIDGRPHGPLRPPPALGEHTDEVLGAMAVPATGRRAS